MRRMKVYALRGAPCAGSEGARALSTEEPLWLSTAGKGVEWQLA